ncbi:transcriptional regulator [Marinomonas phage P12026]|uniref:transcriptional regulator n=1 Tax=Marinomonas phage P12026 TaxID=1176423 RepID=UPI0002688FAB|nr:transcriptional regulator [Marinomonas phage P12026]AFM54894.1 hypothetical protein P12026_48 [Marinomonas phage P12026]
MQTEQAKNFAGNKLQLCKLLGISRMSVSHWGYWVPEKHARTISNMDGCTIPFDSPLYAGTTSIERNGKTYKPAIHIRSTAMLGKHIAMGEKLFFDIGGKMTPITRAEGDIYKNFRTYPMYTEVKQCS